MSSRSAAARNRNHPHTIPSDTQVSLESSQFKKREERSALLLLRCFSVSVLLPHAFPLASCRAHTREPHGHGKNKNKTAQSHKSFRVCVEEEGGERGRRNRRRDSRRRRRSVRVEVVGASRVLSGHEYSEERKTEENQARDKER